MFITGTTGEHLYALQRSPKIQNFMPLYRAMHILGSYELSTLYYNGSEQENTMQTVQHVKCTNLGTSYSAEIKQP